MLHMSMHKYATHKIREPLFSFIDTMLVLILDKKLTGTVQNCSQATKPRVQIREIESFSRRLTRKQSYVRAKGKGSHICFIHVDSREPRVYVPLSLVVT